MEKAVSGPRNAKDGPCNIASLKSVDVDRDIEEQGVGLSKRHVGIV